MQGVEEVRQKRRQGNDEERHLSDDKDVELLDAQLHALKDSQSRAAQTAVVGPPLHFEETMMQEFQSAKEAMMKSTHAHEHVTMRLEEQSA